jgi:hypothetical protein
MTTNWLENFERLKRFLKASGLWMDEKTPQIRRIVVFLMHFVFIELFIVLQTIYIFNAENVEEFCDVLVILLAFITIFVQTINLLLKVKKIEDFAESFKALVEEENWIEINKSGGKLRQRITKIDKIFKMFIASVVAGMFFSLVVPFASHKLPYKMWFPFKSNNLILFWMAVSYQAISGLFAVISVTMETIALLFISCTVGLVEELCERLKSIASERKKECSPVGESSQKPQKQLVIKENNDLVELQKCIEIQLRIKDLTLKIADIFGKVFWWKGFMSSALLCTTAFSLTVVSFYFF